MVLDSASQLVADVGETKERAGRIEVELSRVEFDVGESKERVGRIEVDLKRVEGDVRETKERVGQIQQTLIGHDQRFEALGSSHRGFEARIDALQSHLSLEFRAIHSSFVGAVNLAFENFTRTSYEERISRLEQAIFGNRT